MKEAWDIQYRWDGEWHFHRDSRGRITELTYCLIWLHIGARKESAK